MVVARKRVTRAEVVAVVGVAPGCATTVVASIECGATEIKPAVKGCVVMMVAEEITTDADTGGAAFGFTTTMTSGMAAAIAIAHDAFAPTVGVGVGQVSGGAYVIVAANLLA